VNVVGLVGREPKVLSLMDVLGEFLEFRKEAVRRRTRFELEKTSARLHIVEGYLAVQAAPDAVVAAIRAAPDAKRAAEALEKRPSGSAINKRTRRSPCLCAGSRASSAISSLLRKPS
jgi:DNA gyrase subunit A